MYYKHKKIKLNNAHFINLRFLSDLTLRFVIILPICKTVANRK